MMDEKIVALAGLAAGLTLAGRGLRPVAKVAMRGVIAAADATAGARRGVAGLYAEANAEQRTAGARTDDASPPAPAA